MATAKESSFHGDFVVVGGGIAGVSCTEQLSLLNPDSSIILLTASKTVKAVTNFKKVSRALESFDVEESSSSHLTQACPNVTVVHGHTSNIDTTNKVVQLSNGDRINYNTLCLCSGASPNLVAPDHSHVIGIRDTESVKELQERVKNSERVVVLGNGGIAIELVYELEGCQVIWAIKDLYIGNAFFDEGAAKFFVSQLESSNEQHAGTNEGRGKGPLSEKGVLVTTKPLKRMKYMLDPMGEEDTGSVVVTNNTGTLGSALGPDWSEGLEIKGNADKQSGRSIQVEYNCQVDAILTPDEFKSCDLQETKIAGQNKDNWPVFVKLTNGNTYGCDLIISATGVVPNTKGCVNEHIKLSKVGGGVIVDNEMRTSCAHVYAAGDICSVDWPDSSLLWFQMRLWSQARQMGTYAAKCMTAHKAGDPISLDFCFELFAHITKFFGYKVVLLGHYNSQGVGDGYEILLRVTEGVEYLKVVLKDGRMVGAILIGETDLEETFENLILNQMDLSIYGEDLLNPNIDIEDYFD